MPGEATPKRPVGRPTKFTPELSARICAELSTGKPLTIICDAEGMPSDDTVRNWIEKDTEFSRDIARARATGFDRIAMDALMIADTPLPGVEETLKPTGLEIKKGDMFGQPDR
jgi:hypothetical protein